MAIKDASTAVADPGIRAIAHDSPVASGVECTSKSRYGISPASMSRPMRRDSRVSLRVVDTMVRRTTIHAITATAAATADCRRMLIADRPP
jgi:hypothetical protein